MDTVSSSINTAPRKGSFSPAPAILSCIVITVLIILMWVIQPIAEAHQLTQEIAKTATIDIVMSFDQNGRFRGTFEGITLSTSWEPTEDGCYYKGSAGYGELKWEFGPNISQNSPCNFEDAFSNALAFFDQAVKEMGKTVLKPDVIVKAKKLGEYILATALKAINPG